MTASIIDGNAIAAGIKSRVADEIAALGKRARPPCLAAVLIGDNPAAASYARSQAKEAEGVGMQYRLVRLPADISMAGACEGIARLNTDASVDGIMLHLPVPVPLDAFELQQGIAAGKDVEGVGAANLGLLLMGRDALVPCTAAAAMACLQSTGIDLAGREAVVVGRSIIVGKPLAFVLVAAHATVTLCHTRTRDLAAHTRRAEVLCVAAGVPGLIGGEHVSPGAIVIDVGTQRVSATDSEGRRKTKMVGDVRFEEVVPIARAVTPVPGGVGPVTVATLLANATKACRKSLGF
ncbi:MAG TPA: bifunctional 5,10-methylenetetrahydrofolate dehydrogenase/5,10-methenyltetrahydrofolate cyclohydrolase [Phycisphaerae bacterium]|nr:bifunctional 5,10-methylenetetrahydrofolate dehydrogenase/5,10-methenyltetrahydrofolate cyclohydrolase [Phycisphaerae bacterium]